MGEYVGEYNEQTARPSNHAVWEVNVSDVDDRWRFVGLIGGHTTGPRNGGGIVPLVSARDPPALLLYESMAVRRECGFPWHMRA
jgi:hypothetical protein